MQASFLPSRRATVPSRVHSGKGRVHPAEAHQTDVKPFELDKSQCAIDGFVNPPVVIPEGATAKARQ